MTSPDVPEIEVALTSAAVAGDSGLLYRLASDLMDNGVPFDSLLFDYLIAAERSVGQRWEQGDYLVAEEHAATAAIETLVSLLAGMFDHPPGAPLVVVATAEGDDHSLPARTVAAYLLFLGYRTVFLGANVPGEDLRGFLETEPPVAVVVSAAMTIHLLGARAVVQAAHDVGVPALVGGKAFGVAGEWAAAVGADAWVAKPGEAAEVVERWSGGAPPLAVPPPLPPGLEELIAVRSSILAKAEAELASSHGGAIPRRLTDELRLLLAAVEGALLTGDTRVLVDMLDWQETALAAHGFDSGPVVGALQAALDASSTDGGRLLAGATDIRSA